MANPHGDSEAELGFSDEECDGDLKKKSYSKRNCQDDLLQV